MREAGAQGKAGVFFVRTTNSASESQPPSAPAAMPPPTAPENGNSRINAENALHAKMAELNPPVENQTTAPVYVPPASSGDIMKAKAALEQKMSRLDQQSVNPASRAIVLMPAKPAASEMPPAAEKPLNPANVNYPGKELGLKPIEPPALPISAEVQARLQALDAKYMANQITPEEYHKQRAQILGLPDEMSH